MLIVQGERWGRGESEFVSTPWGEKKKRRSNSIATIFAKEKKVERRELKSGMSVRSLQCGAPAGEGQGEGGRHGS